MLIGIDSGGTFTDFVCYTSGAVRVHKVLSSPANPENAIIQGLKELGLDKLAAEGLAQIVHGTTVATNAALEKKGAATLFVTNSGFVDLLTIGRQVRPQLYQLCPVVEPPPVPPERCLGLNTRVDALGKEITPLDPVELDELVSQIDLKIQAVAVCFLFSYLNNDAELAVATALESRYFTSISSRVLPEYGEYERAMATWLNASLGPVMSVYLKQLQQLIPSSKLTVMQSSGGTIAANQAANRAVDLLLSGPAGGLAAARFLTRDANPRQLLTIDMGGTSTDVAMVGDDIRLTTEGKIGPYPVAVPMVDMHTIGAGGGSIACLDSGGMLHVGPESAGAEPGPACYGRGGVQPTVTDAHVCLGTLPGHLLLGGSLPLDSSAARTAVSSLAEQMGSDSIEEVASGIIALANQHMAQALRVISEQRGLDPTGYSLCSFGGAGAMHACDLAEILGMTEAVVPRYSGIFSALGMVLARRQREMSQSLLKPVDEFTQSEFDACVEELVTRGKAELIAEGVADDQITWVGSVDCRYRGQSFSLNIEARNLIDLVEAFHDKHEGVYGHRLDQEVEVVTIRTSLRGPEAEFQWPDLERRGKRQITHCRVWSVAEDVPCIEREDLGAGEHIQGPALVCDRASTLWLKPGWSLEVSAQGHLFLQHQS